MSVITASAAAAAPPGAGAQALKAPVTNISRCSLHDGPGIRTVVYLKGCGMRCAWCHNPETFKANAEVLYMDSKCIGCGRCLETCPQNCHSVVDGKHIFDRTHCTACGKCTQVCPIHALSYCGEEMTVEDVMKQVRKDAHFYKRSGGGLTLSGGECLLRPEFAAALLSACREEGIHTTVETALGVDRAAVEKVMPHVDLFYCDCKLPTPEKHKKYTGRDQETTLSNIRFLSEHGAHIIIRIPMIPGVNDGPEDMEGFARIIPTLGAGVREIELLRYNNLGASKYEIAGMEFTPFADEPQTKEQMEELRTLLALRLPEHHVFYVI